MANSAYLKFKQAEEADRDPALYLEAQDLYFGCANWLRMALSHNSDIRDAHFLMGKLYEKGLSVDHNLKTAFECYSKAASLGHSKAHLKIGNSYYTGIKE